MPCKSIVRVVLEKQVTEIWKITKEIGTENVNQRMQTEATVLQLKINNNFDSNSLSPCLFHHSKHADFTVHVESR